MLIRTISILFITPKNLFSKFETAMPGKKAVSSSASSDNESPTKKQKTSVSSVSSELAASRLEAGDNILDFKGSKLGDGFKSRVRSLAGDAGTLLRECKGVLYWMWRDRRVQDNWALLYSQKMALELNVPLHVLCCVPPSHGEMTLRHFTFMVEGLREVAEECSELDISFHVKSGSPTDIINSKFLTSHDLGLVVADFSPLREHRAWLEKIMKNLTSFH